MEMKAVNTTDPVRRNETPDRYGQYPRLSGQQLAAVAAYGQRRPTRQGEVLYDQGEEGYDFVVVLDGRVALLGGYGGEQHLVGVHGPRRFLGELGLLSGQEAVLAAVVLERGEVLVVPLERVRELFSRHPTLGDLVLRSYLLRRSLAIEDGASVGIVGSRSLTDTRRLRGFAARNRLRQRWIDSDDRRAEAPLRELGVAPQQTLVVLWRGEPGPGNPSNAELARMIALLVPSSGETVCDLVLVGVGAGELAAVVHAAADGLAAVGLAAISPELLPGSLFWIEGYPGFPAGISEAELRACSRAGRHPGSPGRTAGREDRDRAGRWPRCRHPRRRQRDRRPPGRRRRWQCQAHRTPPGRVRGDGHPLRPAADGRPAQGRQAAAQREPAVRPHERERRRFLPGARRRAALGLAARQRCRFGALITPEVATTPRSSRASTGGWCSGRRRCGAQRARPP
jgi:CRP-like cAMP-binding protein